MTQTIDGETFAQITFDAIVALITTLEKAASDLDPHERRICNFGPTSDLADCIFDAVTDPIDWYDDGERNAYDMKHAMNDTFKRLRIAAYGKSQWDRTREQARVNAAAKRFQEGVE